MTVLWPNGGTAAPAPVGGSGFRASGEYGMRFHPIDHVWRLHAGIDLIGISTGRIHSPVSGTVTISSYYGSYGNLVEVTAANGDRFRMAHNSQLLCRRGQHVNQGDVVAIWGTTGASTGVHCHFEVIPRGGSQVNPRPYMAEANAAPAGGGGKPVTPAPIPEEDDMAKNSGVYYDRKNPANGKITTVYLVFNSDSGWFHEFSNGEGNGPMPGDYNNALAKALDTPSWAKITESHARVIKAALAVVNDRDVSGEVTVTIDPADLPAA